MQIRIREVTSGYLFFVSVHITDGLKNDKASLCKVFLTPFVVCAFDVDRYKWYVLSTESEIPIDRLRRPKKIERQQSNWCRNEGEIKSETIY